PVGPVAALADRHSFHAQGPPLRLAAGDRLELFDRVLLVGPARRDLSNPDRPEDDPLRAGRGFRSGRAALVGAMEAAFRQPAGRRRHDIFRAGRFHDREGRQTRVGYLSSSLRMSPSPWPTSSRAFTAALENETILASAFKFLPFDPVQ